MHHINIWRELIKSHMYILNKFPVHLREGDFRFLNFAHTSRNKAVIFNSTCQEYQCKGRNFGRSASISVNFLGFSPGRRKTRQERRRHRLALILSSTSVRGTLRRRLPAPPCSISIDTSGRNYARGSSGVGVSRSPGAPARISGARIHRKAPDWSTLRGGAYRFSKRHCPPRAPLSSRSSSSPSS